MIYTLKLSLYIENVLNIIFDYFRDVCALSIMTKQLISVTILQTLLLIMHYLLFQANLELYVISTSAGFTILQSLEILIKNDIFILLYIRNNSITTLISHIMIFLAQHL